MKDENKHRRQNIFPRVLAAILLLLLYGFGYYRQLVLFIQYRSALQETVELLWEEADRIDTADIPDQYRNGQSPQISASLSENHTTVILYQWEPYLPEPDQPFVTEYHTVPIPLPLEERPELAAVLGRLLEAGIDRIDCFDLSHDTRFSSRSTQEVWFHMDNSAMHYIIYTESWQLGTSWDITMADGPGYPLSGRWLGPHWYVAKSHYDKNNIYWRT